MSGTVKDQHDGQFELTRVCCDCSNIPCIWEANVKDMELFAEAQNDKEAQQRHSMYCQMALIINDGPSSRGNRVKLLSCVVSGVRDLFPDPDLVYTGHVKKVV
jgi:hypothetical protein